MGKGKLFSFERPVKEKRFRITGNNAINILPAEMWSAILDKIEDFDTLWKCYNTCHTWRSILGPVSNWGLETILPLVVKYLDIEAILSCRLVSKRWLAVLDTLTSDECSSSPSHLSPSWNLTSIPKIQSILNGLTKYPEEKCPIFGRNLQISNLDTDATTADIEEHIDHSCTLTALMGHHVRHLSLVYDSTQLTAFGLGFVVTNHLTNMPCLRSLKIRYIFVDGISVEAELQRGANLVSYINQNPLPFIPTLESIVFPFDCDVPLQILQSFLVTRHSSRIKKLEIKLARLVPDLLPILTALTDLTLFVSSNDDIRILLRCPAPIQKLHLYFGVLVNLSSEKLIEVVAHFSQLHELKITLVGNSRIDDFTTGFPNQMNCSSLKKVCIDFDGREHDFNFDRRVSFNFLSYFTGLDDLQVFKRIMGPGLTALTHALDRHRGFFADRNMEVVEMWNFIYSGNITQSNIWEVLPTLQTIRYQWHGHPEGKEVHFHTRYVYEQKKKKRNKLVQRAGRTVRRVCLGVLEFML